MFEKMLQWVKKWLVGSTESELQRYLAGAGATSPADLENRIREWERKQAKQNLWF